MGSGGSEDVVFGRSEVMVLGEEDSSWLTIEDMNTCRSAASACTRMEQGVKENVSGRMTR